MVIRFNCTACQTEMKIGEAISESKKVRCNGCGLVILLNPDPANPFNVVATIPKKTEKRKEISDSTKRNILLSILGIIGLFLAATYWLTMSGPTDRAAIDGSVFLDDAPLESGTIVFRLLDESKPIVVEIPIVRGRYSARATWGPGIGTNKVEITGDVDDTIAARFNTASELKIDIAPGSNQQKQFDVKSK